MLGAFLNGLAGAIQYQKLGEHLRASDVIEAIPEAMNDPIGSFQKKVYTRIL